MKCLTTLLPTLLVFSIPGWAAKLDPFITNCSLSLPILSQLQTIFIDMVDAPDILLKTCLLKHIENDQTVTLFKIHEKEMELNLTEALFLTSDFPTVMLMTERFSLELIDAAFLRTVFKTHWSIVYIIVTGDKEFKCKDGTMNSQDFMLLEKIMNKLWLKLRIMLVGVVFPVACNHKIVLYNGKSPSNTSLYNRRIRLYDNTPPINIYRTFFKSGIKLSEQYPIRASLFFRYPTSITTCRKSHYIRRFNLDLTYGFCGLDGMVMHDVLSYFKFNLTFSEDESCINYGYAETGNVSGSLGCIARKELDVSFNSRFMTMYADESIYYLYYVTTDSLCALVKQSEVIPIWIGVYHVFTFTVFSLVATAIVTMGILMWVTAIIEKIVTGKKPMTLYYYICDATITSMFGYSLGRKKTILRGTCLCFSIIITTIFQSHTNRVHTTLQRYRSIETLQQLFNYGATLYTSPAIKDLMRQITDPNDKLQEDFINLAKLSSGMKLDFVIDNPKVTTLDRKNDVTMQILEHYTDDDGKPLLHIVDECFNTYYLSYIARTGFPFFEDLRGFIERLNEAGLPAMYYTWTQRMLGIPELTFKYHREPRPFTEITLGNLRVAYGILFFGYVLCTMVFLVERWKGKNRRHSDNGRVSKRKPGKRNMCDSLQHYRM